MDAARFEEQIAYLARHRRCVTIAQLLSYLDAGTIPPYTTVVTFDDGFANNLTVALPILERYRVPAAVFVTTGYIGAADLLWPERVAALLDLSHNRSFALRSMQIHTADAKSKQVSYRTVADAYKQLTPEAGELLLAELAAATQVSADRLREHESWEQLRTMSWSELKQLSDSPLIEIGAHTVSHTVLSRVDDARALHEIADSKHALDASGCGAKYFAYPNGGLGDYTSHHRQMTIDAGFDAVFSAISGVITATTDRFDMPRFGVGATATINDIDYALNGGLSRT
jgi:peptidoglycan/xylan/chitin deacetylase (PgdA/CDA1 family)